MESSVKNPETPKNLNESSENLSSSEQFSPFSFDIPFDFRLINYQKYQPDPHYLGTKQPQMTANMRTILLDWMMEVCNDYMLKRQTFHMALNYVDRFLSKIPDFPKAKLQLLGVVSLYISSKIEEIHPPKLEEFAVVGHDYGLEEIKNFEELILKTLRFELNPSVIPFWSDWFMSQWDLFIEEKQADSSFAILQISSNFNEKNDDQISWNSEKIIQFRQPNENNYKLFREFFQLVDCAVLDPEFMEKDGKKVVLTFFCMIIWGFFMRVEWRKIGERYREILGEESKITRKLIEEFLQRTSDCQLSDLFNVFEFCAKFFELKIKYDYPLATKINRENVLEVLYIDIC